MAAHPLTVNGLITDFSQTEFTIADPETGAEKKFRGGVTAISWDFGHDGKNEYANQGPPIGQTPGHQQYNSAMEMFEISYKELRTFLGPGYMRRFFVFTANWEINGETDKVEITARFQKVNAPFTQGSAHKRQINLLPIKIVEGEEQVDPFAES